MSAIDRDAWIAAVLAAPAEALVLADLLEEHGHGLAARRLRTRYRRYARKRDRLARHYDHWEVTQRAWRAGWAEVAVATRRALLADQDVLFVAYVAKLLEEVDS